MATHTQGKAGGGGGRKGVGEWAAQRSTDQKVVIPSRTPSTAQSSSYKCMNLDTGMRDDSKVIARILEHKLATDATQTA